MKKLFIVFIALFASLAVVSCAGDATEATDTGTTEAPGALRVGMDLRYPPFETTVEGTDTPEGISVDVAMAFGEYLGREVEIVNLNFASLIPALNAGTIDIVIASMSITEEREQAVDFTDPYFYFKIISLLNKDFADANSLDQDSSVEDLLAVENTQYVGIIGQVSTTIPESYGKTVTDAADLGTAVESVAQGFTDVLFMSANPVVDGFNANPDDTIVLWDAVQSSPIGMAVKEGNTALLEQANAFIDTFADEGGLYEQLSEDWDALLLEELGRYGLEFYINQ